jgi:hypothetical protein
MGTGSFPEVKRPGSGGDHPPSSAEVKERVELYLYFPSRPSWPVYVTITNQQCHPLQCGSVKFFTTKWSYLVSSLELITPSVMTCPVYYANCAQLTSSVLPTAKLRFPPCLITYHTMKNNETD